MKILSNKTYQGMVDAYNGLLEENNKLDKKYKNTCEQYQTVCDELTSEKMNLEQEILNLKEENKKLLGAKGGYTKEINKLKKQVEELDFKLKESMTGKYVLKKIPSGRKPKSQTMKIKDCSRISNISRKVFGDK